MIGWRRLWDWRRRRDLRGRQEGKAVCQLLGGEPRKVKTYASSMSRTNSPDAEIERFKRWRDDHGADAFKYRIGDPVGKDQEPHAGRSAALMAGMASNFGDDYLIADGNGGFSPTKAIEVARRLRDHGVDQFEEPCPYWEIDQTVEVRAADVLPISGGEQDFDMLRWKLLLEKGALDIAQPDICYLGGITRTLAVARLAEAYGIPVMPHSANTSWVSVFTAHLMAALPNAAALMEFSVEDTPWSRASYAPCLEMKDGHVELDDTPGRGFVPRQDWLEKADYRSVDAGHV